MTRKRRNLPKKYKQIYEKLYLDYSESRGLIRKLVLVLKIYFHSKVYKSHINGKSILEIGAGNLNHLKFEKNFDYYDVVEPKTFLLKRAEKSSIDLIRNSYKSIDEISGENIYEKIIAIAVLEHLNELDNFLKKVSKLLKPTGRFIVQIPAEGEFLWWLSWRLTTGVDFWLKYNLDYGVIMRYEHINTAKNIISLLDKYFYILNSYSYPFNFKNCRFYIHLVMTKK